MTLSGSYLTISQAAKDLGVTRQTISRWIAQGKLSAEKVAREKLIPKEQLEALKTIESMSLLMEMISHVLQSTLDYRPKQLEVDVPPGNKPYQVKIVNPVGKIEVIEVTPRFDASGRLAKLEFIELGELQPPTDGEDFKPEIQITFGVNKKGKAVKAIYRDLKTGVAVHKGRNV